MKTKNIIAYAAVGIIVIVVAYSVLFRTPNNSSNPSLQSTDQLIANSKAAAIEQYQKQFCGLNPTTNSTGYITEYKLPATCEMPLGIVVDSQAGKIWYVSTKQGTLGELQSCYK